MPRRRIPTTPVRRTVFLDHGAIRFALYAVKDDEYSVLSRGAMTPDWQSKYDAAAKQLQALLDKIEQR